MGLIVLSTQIDAVVMEGALAVLEGGHPKGKGVGEEGGRGFGGGGWYSGWNVNANLCNEAAYC